MRLRRASEASASWSWENSIRYRRVRPRRGAVGFFVLECLCAALLVTLLAGAAGERKVVLYRVEHRVAAELMPVAEAALGSAGSATLEAGTNAILLVGPERDVAATLEVLRIQDGALRQIVVRQEWVRISEIRAANVEIQWSVRSGEVRVGNIRAPKPENAAAMHAFAEFRSAHVKRAATLTSVEGASSRISTGTVVPYAAAPAGDPVSGLRHPTGTTWVDVGTGFETRTRLLGNGRIRVELSPFASRLTPSGSIEGASAATTLELAPGEIRVLGGLGARGTRTDHEVGDRLEHEREGEAQVLLVSAELLER
jgi:hypothetical protein